MPAPALSKDQRDRIVALFQRVYTQASRSALVPAAVTEQRFLGRVDYSGSDLIFNLHLLQQAITFGGNVLNELILECRRHVDDDVRADFADVLTFVASTPYVSNASDATRAIPLATMNRRQLIDFLEGLNEANLARVIIRVEGFHDTLNRTVPERVAGLIGFVESSVGPGRANLVAIVQELFRSNRA